MIRQDRAPSFHAGQGSQVDGESSLGDQAGSHESPLTNHGFLPVTACRVERDAND